MLPPLLCATSPGVPWSATAPLSSTTTRSKSMIESSLRETAMTVEKGKPECTALWRQASVCGSNGLAASSSSSSAGCLSAARARLRRWRCPRLKSPPSGKSRWSSPREDDSAKLVRLAAESACQIRSSEWHSKGSMLYRNVPEKSTGSCGTRPSACRSAARPTCLASTPPSSTRPALGSRMRMSASSRVDLPAPLGPTTPSRSLGPRLRLTPLRASRGASP
mmetsp:Transcript_41639/g.120613  ORF Transcript_41639/g.120613 Transcript_41639/m.120613 type:complete len:221 (+) Transcript_41639:148-810(+)